MQFSSARLKAKGTVKSKLISLIFLEEGSDRTGVLDTKTGKFSHNSGIRACVYDDVRGWNTNRI
jgi:hypothetical protein